MPKTETGHICGEDHYEAKLNAEIVREIRATPEISQAEWVRKLEREYGIYVTKNTVRDARRGTTWKNVTEEGQEGLWEGQRPDWYTEWREER